MGFAISNRMTHDPFSHIAITFSGGGFRAAAFALGTLSFLNKVKWNGQPMLKNVKAISTVSGGTITGVAYGESLVNQTGFDAFFKKLYKSFQGDDLLNEALAILEDPDNEVWASSHKRRTLINAFSLAYRSKLTDAAFGIFFPGKIGHLDEVIFNATEFQNAQPFRFQSRGWLGNRQLNENDAILKACKNFLPLSDIIASSSCFPVGFEPIVFPHDFLKHDSQLFIDIAKDDKYKNGVGLMDGGIVDNQGIASILLAQKRREGPNSDLDPFSLVIVTDVASPYLEPWQRSDESTKPWAKSSIDNFDWNVIPFFASKTPWYIWVLMLISVAGVVASFFEWSEVFNEKILTVIGTLGLTISLGYALGMPKVKKYLQGKINDTLNDLVQLVPDFYRPLLKRFRKLELRVLERMIRERGASTVSLLSDVFLKHVRRLNYSSLYSDGEWVAKRIGNFVYELTDYDFKKKQQTNSEDEKKSFMSKVDPELTDPGEKIHKSAYIAAKMDTTLWFDNEHESKQTLEHLIACGQYTTCYNLLIYLTELEYSDSSPIKGRCFEQPEFKKLYDDLMTEWKALKADPLIWLKLETRN